MRFTMHSPVLDALRILARSCTLRAPVYTQPTGLCAAAGGSNSLVIKPAADGGPAAVARLGSHTDLGWYACAVADRDAAIPAGVLEQPPSRQQAGAPIPLPLTPPPVFVVEPFVDTERCAFSLTIAFPLPQHCDCVVLHGAFRFFLALSEDRSCRGTANQMSLLKVHAVGARTGANF